MQKEALDALALLECSASPAPWHVIHINDDLCMSMVAITNHAPPDDEWAGLDWEGSQVLAATLVQEPPYVVPVDKCWNENAELIAAMRNHLPELLRLARIGLAADRQA